MPKAINDPTHVGSQPYINYIKLLKKKCRASKKDMRKFYVTFYNEYNDIVNSIITLDSGEKANEILFHVKINERYINSHSMTHYCTQILSWSLIEE